MKTVKTSLLKMAMLIAISVLMVFLVSCKTGTDGTGGNTTQPVTMTASTITEGTIATTFETSKVTTGTATQPPVTTTTEATGITTQTPVTTTTEASIVTTQPTVTTTVSPPNPDTVENVRDASTNECKVGEVQPDKTNFVIIVPEYHTSVIGQIQAAIALTKLHYSNELNDIILEGYLIDGHEIDYSNIYKSCGNDVRIIQSVAVKLLSEGEISAVEFMKLAFNEMNIYPTEYAGNYNIDNPPDDFDDTLNAYIDKIYDFDPKEANDWVDKINVVFEDVNLEKVLDLFESLDEYAQGKIKLTEHEHNGMLAYNAFLRSRIASSAELSKIAEEKSKDPNISLSAMIIGAAHKDGIFSDLTKKSVSYVELTPMVFFEEKDEDGKFHKSDMDFDVFLDKSDNKSVLSKGIAKILDDIQKPLATDYQSDSKSASSETLEHIKKPEPIINRNPIVETRIEIYASTIRICDYMLNGEGATASDTSLVEFTDGLEGKFVKIDPTKIEIIDEPNNMKSVFFEVQIKPYNETIYLKACMKENTEMTLIEMLEQAEKACRNETGFRRQAEDDNGVVKLGSFGSEEVSFVAGLERETVKNFKAAIISG